MKDVATRRSTDDELELLLLDAENDLPISGHHLSSGSSTNHDRQIHRISPIHNASGLKVDSATKMDVSTSGKEVKIVEELGGNGISKSEVELSRGMPSLAREDGKKAEVVEEVNAAVKTGRGSPCSCRSLNTSLVSIPPPLQLECDRPFSSSSVQLGAFPSAPHLPSSSSDSHQLFTETKARMENARTNIQHFLHSEKTKTSDVSYSSQWTSVNHGDRLVNHEGRLVNHENRLVNHEHRLVNHDGRLVNQENILVNHEDRLVNHEDRLVNHGDRLVNSRAVSHTSLGGKPEHSSVDNSVGKILLLASSSHRDTLGQVHEGSCPPTDAVFMETASSSCQNVSDERPQQTSVKCENSGRSWAEILEQSSGNNRSGRSITAAAPPDLSGNWDDDVTPQMLDLLKAKVAELKRRQEQLERDHFFVIQAPLDTRTTLPANPATKPANVSSLVCGHGNSPSSSSGVSVSERSDEVVDVVKTGENRLQSSQNLFHRTSAVRSLMSQFTQAAASSQSQKPEVLEATSAVDVVCHASSDHNTHTDCSAARCLYDLLPSSQHPLASSSSSHRHEVKSGGSTGAFEQSVGDVLESKTDARTSLVDSSGRVVSSLHAPCVTLDSQPGSLHTCLPVMTLDSLPHNSLSPTSVIPNTANPNIGLSSVQPGSVVTNTSIVMSMGNAGNMTENPSTVDSSDMVAAVSACNSLSSDCCKTVSVSQLPVKTAVTDACLEVVAGSDASGIAGICSQSADCRSVASVSVCANGNAATPFQQSRYSPVDTVAATRQNHGNAENFVHVPSTSAALSDMIQQLTARRLSQSVY